ncbi:MAG: class I SAM-dependent methyltransferase [Ilumatobacteraceae bacterium]
MTDNLWLRAIEENPEHSSWYVERFRAMAAEGRDLDGEARLVDAIAPRNARILDAGCGPGRVGGRLHRLGHTVVGVDLDPALIAAAEHDHSGPIWLTADLADLDLARHGHAAEFDVIVCAGNVVTFLDPTTRRQALGRLGAHLAADGRLVIGFGLGRGYPLDEFVADVEAVGLHAGLLLATWDLRPFVDGSDFVVAVLTSAALDEAST